MSRRAKLSLPQHIPLSMNLKTGMYEVIESGILYQLTFTQLNDLKLYCRSNHGHMIPTMDSWYSSLTSYSRKFVKRTSQEPENNCFYPDE